ncbi:MAG TPA: secondary thiamine-phosphate synthase enzyme YjbQ [Candidatus Polarisedimenticolia bacterium]|nr:secondary thiamine-phosphate synthase enzyme YjbQ [Candidatus Polarisedimenticolia bacterium]
MEAIDLSVQAPAIYHDRSEIRTEDRMQFIDITGWVARRLRLSGIDRGIALVRVLHTTAAIVVNENEPLLLDDLKAMLERLAPEGETYAHDDFLRRRVNVEPGERRNGHAHARALLLGESKQIGVLEGSLELGRWQSIFLVELDGPRRRTVSVTVMGSRRGQP